jgi:hypothetical protein
VAEYTYEQMARLMFINVWVHMQHSASAYSSTNIL